jgi:hypothetical protein
MLLIDKGTDAYGGGRSGGESVARDVGGLRTMVEVIYSSQAVDLS